MPVTFEEPTYARQSPTTRKQSFLTRAVISMGLAKDEKGASRALVVVLVIVIALTIAVAVMSFGGSGTPEPLPDPVV